MDKEDIKKIIRDYFNEEKAEFKRVVKEIIEEDSSYIFQNDIFQDVVKQRHIGEGVRFIRSGVAASRPTSGEKEGAIYFATDTFVLSCWTGSSWKTTTLS